MHTHKIKELRIKIKSEWETEIKDFYFPSKEQFLNQKFYARIFAHFIKGLRIWIAHYLCKMWKKN